jgi:replicative superfamily II helicase
VGIHHAGTFRADRTLTEQLFEQGLIKFFVVLPLYLGESIFRHTVIIKGTEMYDPSRGGFIEVLVFWMSCRSLVEPEDPNMIIRDIRSY